MSCLLALFCEAISHAPCAFLLSLFLVFFVSLRARGPQAQSAEMYAAEGASFATVARGSPHSGPFGFPTSAPALALLAAAPYGCLPLLDALTADEGPRGDGDDAQAYAPVLASYHGGHPQFAACGADTPWRAGGLATHANHFGVHHYAGTVSFCLRARSRNRKFTLLHVILPLFRL